MHTFLKQTDARKSADIVSQRFNSRRMNDIMKLGHA